VLGSRERSLHVFVLSLTLWDPLIPPDPPVLTAILLPLLMVPV